MGKGKGLHLGLPLEVAAALLVLACVESHSLFTSLPDFGFSSLDNHGIQAR